MTGYTLEEIVKWGLALIVIGVVIFLLYMHFFPPVSGTFWEKINNATKIFKVGKEKLDYEFEMPSYMEDNVETINETIFILQDKNIPVGATTEDIIEHSLELKDFQGCELTVNQDYKGDLKLMVKNVKGQIKYYKTNTPYSPCIIDITEEDSKNYKNNLNYRIEYAPEHIKFVERINFKEYTTISLSKIKTFRVYKKQKSDEIYEGDYVFLEEYALIKINKNICFVGYRKT